MQMVQFKATRWGETTCGDFAKTEVDVLMRVDAIQVVMPSVIHEGKTEVCTTNATFITNTSFQAMRTILAAAGVEF